MTQNDQNATESRFPNMKLLALSAGQPFLYLQESGKPGGKKLADEIIKILKKQFTAKPLGAMDGFDWIDIDFQIGTQKVTLTSDCWLGLGLIAESRDGESLLLEIARVLDSQSKNSMIADSNRAKIGE